MVLFFALVALVLLTMTGIGFMRAVDTNQLLAGNLAFSRASVAIADMGMEAARTTAANLGSANLLRANGAAGTGYFAYVDSSAANTANGAFNDYRQYDWTQAAIVNTAVAPFTTATAALMNGYTVSYLIHRMCMSPGDPKIANCLTAASGGNNEGAVSNSNNQGSGSPLTPMYRVTIRVTGPRQSTTYIQVWMS